MTRAQLRISSDSGVTELNVEVAESFFSRLRGLLGRRPLTVGEGLIIAPCSGIHTISMSQAIDVVFVSKAGVVCGTAENVPPWRPQICMEAAYVVELWPGAINAIGLVRGTTVSRCRQ